MQGGQAAAQWSSWLAGQIVLMPSAGLLGHVKGASHSAVEEYLSRSF